MDGGRFFFRLGRAADDRIRLTIKQAGKTTHSFMSNKGTAFSVKVK